MADRISKARRSWNMSRIKGRDTTCEIKLRSSLHRAGYRFRVHDTRLPGRPDIVLPKYRTVVFVHGCFWHRHAGCVNAATPKTNQHFWLAKFRATVKRDHRNAVALVELGWQVLTVWECQINHDVGQVTNRVENKLRLVRAA